MNLLTKITAVIAGITVAASAAVIPISASAEEILVLGTESQDLYDMFNGNEVDMGTSGCVTLNADRSIKLTGNGGWVSLPNSGSLKGFSPDTQATKYQLSFDYNGSWSQTTISNNQGFYLEKFNADVTLQDDSKDNVSFNNRSVKNQSTVTMGDDEWEHYAIDMDLSSENVKRVDKIYLRIALRSVNAGSVTIKNLKLTPYESKAVVAKIGDTPYTSLDDAFDEAIKGSDVTINVLEDTTTTKSGLYMSNNPKICRIYSADNTPKTVGVNTTGNLFDWDTVEFNYINLAKSGDVVPESIAASQKNSPGSFTFKNGSISGMEFSDRISGFGINNLENAQINSNKVVSDLFLIAKDSEIKNSTITGNTSSGYGVEAASGCTLTITDSTINGNTITNHNGSDVTIWNGSTVVLAGSTQVGKIYIYDGIVKLASSFTGSAVITGNNLSLSDGTVIADVETDADISGITVDGLDTEKYELKLENGKLVIAEKTVEPINPSAQLENANWGYTGNDNTYQTEGNTITDGNETVYGYKATFSALENGTYTKAVLTADPVDEDKEAKTSEKKLEGITLEAGGGAIFYVISNAALDTSNSSITLK